MMHGPINIKISFHISVLLIVMKMVTNCEKEQISEHAVPGNEMVK